jgi:hypothetical protein
VVAAARAAAQIVTATIPCASREVTQIAAATIPCASQEVPKIAPSCVLTALRLRAVPPQVTGSRTLAARVATVPISHYPRHPKAPNLFAPLLEILDGGRVESWVLG